MINIRKILSVGAKIRNSGLNNTCAVTGTTTAMITLTRKSPHVRPARAHKDFPTESPSMPKIYHTVTHTHANNDIQDFPSVPFPATQ